jgi:hypothetical protein
MMSTVDFRRDFWLSRGEIPLCPNMTLPPTKGQAKIALMVKD